MSMQATIRSLAALTTVLALGLAASATAAARTLANLAQAGEQAAALELIRAGHDVNVPQGDGTTALHWAVYRMDERLAQTLLDQGADPNAVNLYGATPLAEAVKVGQPGLVEMLLDAGADIESPNEDGQTALMLAVRVGVPEVARLLIERGADVNARERWRGQTPLMWAADSRHAEITQLLVEHGADVEVRAKAGEWATQITSEPRGQYRPTGGFTALHYAVRSACTGCARAILDAGADPNRPNPDAVSPLKIALDNSAYDAAKLLLERGADPHAQDWWGRTPLYVAVDMSSFTGRGARAVDEDGTTALDIARMLLEAGVNPNPQLNFHRPSRGSNIGRFTDDLLTTGATPLLRAALGHDVEAVELLLEHGAQADLPNVMGVTPLMSAAGIGAPGRGGRLNFRGGAQAGAIATMEMLLAAGADVNARVTDVNSRSARIARPSSMTDREGQTALYGAASGGWSRVVEFLIEHGAEVDMVDALGCSPIDAALGRECGGRGNTGSEETAEILRRAGGRD